MGYRSRWLAVRAGDRAEVVSRLKLVIAEELDEEVWDTGLYALDMPPWVVVIGNGWDFKDLLERSQAAELSEHGEVVFFETDDSSMCAEIASFNGGQVVWSLGHGDGTAVIEGALPDLARAALAAAHDQQTAAVGRKADVDYGYDALAVIGHRLVGFRHDQTLGSGAHLPIYRLDTVDPERSVPWDVATGAVDRDREDPPMEAVLAAARRVLGSRAVTAVVNDVGDVEVYVLGRARANPSSDEVPLAAFRAKGGEADEGDELMVQLFYLPQHRERAADLHDVGLAQLFGIPRDAFDAMQRALAPWFSKTTT